MTIVIPLSCGQATLIDDEDAALAELTWCAMPRRRGGGFYAVRRELRDGRRHWIYLHREVLKMDPADKREGDHINLNTLDNRRGNLRIATLSQNKQNTRSRSSVGYKGVCRRRGSKFTAFIRIDGRQICLGTFNDAEEAARAYDRRAVEHFGPFAWVNFPLAEYPRLLCPAAIPSAEAVVRRQRRPVSQGIVQTIAKSIAEMPEGLLQREIAERLGVHQSTVCRALKRLAA